MCALIKITTNKTSRGLLPHSPFPHQSMAGAWKVPFCFPNPQAGAQKGSCKAPNPLDIYICKYTRSQQPVAAHPPPPIECGSPAQCSSPGECDPSSLMRSLQLNAALRLSPARATVTLTHLRQAPAFEYSLFLLRDSHRDGWRLEARNLGTLEA